MIRIIAGEFRGRKLKVPAGNDVRPTSDRVREALFNLLSSLLSWNEMTVLDLYAGSGALGLEALSRGAKHAIFVEATHKNLKILQQKLALLPAIRTGSLIVVESPNARELNFPANLELLKHRRYGSVTLDILRKC